MKYLTRLLVVLTLGLTVTSCDAMKSPEAKKLAVNFLQEAGKAAAVEVADASLIVFDTKINELQAQLDTYRASLPQPVSFKDAAKLAGYATALRAAREARSAAQAKINSLRNSPVFTPPASDPGGSAAGSTVPVASTSSFLQPILVATGK
jgi:hypothetical protein